MMSKISKLLNISEFNSLNNRLPLVAGMMDNKDLSKSHSGQASRYSLAFFVPKFWKASQATQDKDTTHHPKSTGVNRHILLAILPAVYDGVTLQNKPIGKYAGRFYVTESEPHHPMIFHSVVTTQNYIGGHHCA